MILPNTSVTVIQKDLWHEWETLVLPPPPPTYTPPTQMEDSMTGNAKDHWLPWYTHTVQWASQHHSCFPTAKKKNPSQLFHKQCVNQQTQKAYLGVPSSNQSPLRISLDELPGTAVASDNDGTHFQLIQIKGGPHIDWIVWPWAAAHRLWSHTSYSSVRRQPHHFSPSPPPSLHHLPSPSRPPPCQVLLFWSPIVCNDGPAGISHPSETNRRNQSADNIHTA